jgi:hypothetical protein
MSMAIARDGKGSRGTKAAPRKVLATLGGSHRIVFRFPQAPEGQRPPKGEAIALPDALMRHVLQTRLSERESCLLWYLVFETYGQHRQSAELSDVEISAQTKIPRQRIPSIIEKLRASEFIR